jgi:hypothetical protein
MRFVLIRQHSFLLRDAKISISGLKGSSTVSPLGVADRGRSAQKEPASHARWRCQFSPHANTKSEAPLRKGRSHQAGP